MQLNSKFRGAVNKSRESQVLLSIERKLLNFLGVTNSQRNHYANLGKNVGFGGWGGGNV